MDLIFLLQPALRGLYFFQAYIVSAVLPEDFDVGAGLAIDVGELLGAGGGYQRIGSTCADEDGLALEIRPCIRHEGNHWMQQNSGSQYAGAQQEQTSGNIRAIGEADRDHLALVKVVERAGLVDEISQLAATLLQILDVEHSLGEAAEEAWHAIFQHVAARAELARARYKHTP